MTSVLLTAWPRRPWGPIHPIYPGRRCVVKSWPYQYGQEEITDRLFLPMLLEAIRAVDDGIVRGPADVDVGVTLGLSFPASRGGILAWCDTEGASSIMDRLSRYQSLAPWFQPPPMLARMGRDGERLSCSFRLTPAVRLQQRIPHGRSQPRSGSVPAWLK